MRRREFTSKTLFSLMAVVAALCGGWCLVSRMNHGPSSERADSSSVHLPESLEGRDLQESLRKNFLGSNPIRFLSWNGRWIGTDVDAEIEMRTDGTARLTEYGDAISYYDGTYSINNGSELTLQLYGYPAHWPTMRVYRDHATLLLAPTDRLTGAPSFPTGDARFWPFRQINQ